MVEIQLTWLGACNKEICEMSALFGYLPNMVQQQNPPKPMVPAQPVADRADIKAETAPSITRKVAPNFEGSASSQANVNTGAKQQKSIDAEATKIAAESEVVANDQAASEQLTPADLADQRARELAKAREHATQYREYKARLESSQSDSSAKISEGAEKAPRMDVRIPLLDEMPDRPLPRLGVPTV
jgi:hypothetical protein